MDTRFFMHIVKTLIFQNSSHISELWTYNFFMHNMKTPITLNSSLNSELWTHDTFIDTVKSDLFLSTLRSLVGYGHVKTS